jgi:hypothetical protein
MEGNRVSMVPSHWGEAVGVEGKMHPRGTGHPVPPVVVVVVMLRPPEALLSELTVFRDMVAALRSQPAQVAGLAVAVAVAVAE